MQGGDEVGSSRSGRSGLQLPTLGRPRIRSALLLAFLRTAQRHGRTLAEQRAIVLRVLTHVREAHAASGGADRSRSAAGARQRGARTSQPLTLDEADRRG